MVINFTEEGLPATPNDAFKMALFNNNFVKALNLLQAIDDQSLQDYLMNPNGQVEINALMRDLVIFEAKTDKSFLRGLCIGIAASCVDYESHQAEGHGVIPTLRAGLALLRNTETDVVTGREWEAPK